MDEDFNWEDFGKWAIRLLIVGLVIGAIVLVWVNILGPAFNQASYNNYINSPQHLQAIAQRAADDCQQLAQATDTTTKKAIEQDIYQLVSDVDLSKVQMPSAVRQCVNHAVSDATSP